MIRERLSPQKPRKNSEEEGRQRSKSLFILHNKSDLHNIKDDHPTCAIQIEAFVKKPFFGQPKNYYLPHYVISLHNFAQVSSHTLNQVIMHPGTSDALARHDGGKVLSTLLSAQNLEHISTCALEKIIYSTPQDRFSHDNVIRISRLPNFRYVSGHALCKILGVESLRKASNDTLKSIIYADKFKEFPPELFNTLLNECHARQLIDGHMCAQLVANKSAKFLPKEIYEKILNHINLSQISSNGLVNILHDGDKVIFDKIKEFPNLPTNSLALLSDTDMEQVGLLHKNFNAENIATYTARDLASLSHAAIKEMLEFLARPENYRLRQYIFSRDILGGLRANQISALPPQWITPDVIEHIPSLAMHGFTPRQFQEISETALHHLTPSQFSNISHVVFDHITEDQWRALPPATLSGLTASQMSVIPGRMLSIISCEQYQYIPPKALSVLSADQVAYLPIKYLYPRQLEKIPLESLRGLGKLIFPNFITPLNEEFYTRLEKGNPSIRRNGQSHYEKYHGGLIPDASYILPIVRNPMQCFAAQPDGVKVYGIHNLRRNDFANISLEDQHNISPDCFGLLRLDQFKALLEIYPPGSEKVGSEIIRGITPEMIYQIPPSYFSAFTLESFKLLGSRFNNTVEIWAAISARQWSFLDPAVMKALPRLQTLNR